jgi:hypothetical protein
MQWQHEKDIDTDKHLLDREVAACIQGKRGSGTVLTHAMTRQDDHVYGSMGIHDGGKV